MTDFLAAIVFRYLLLQALIMLAKDSVTRIAAQSCTVLAIRRFTAPNDGFVN
jgi:hypothetical protein